MDQHTLRINSGTGIDFELEVAALGARSYAFIVDWHVRVALALIWGFAGTLVNSYWIDNPAFGYFGVMVPTTAIYLLYHPVVELYMDGNSPGKRYAGVKIVTLEGTSPTRTAILLRNALRIVDSLPLTYVVGIVSCLVTEQSVRIGDLAAGTLLVYEPGKRERLSGVQSWGASDLSVAQLQMVRRLLERWQELDSAVRVDLARRLLDKLAIPSGGRNDQELELRLRELIHADE